jgi:hypothetical protein
VLKNQILFGEFSRVKIRPKVKKKSPKFYTWFKKGVAKNREEFLFLF